ncbi:hypothetical protein H6504_04325 [Candidatus Woesearchaeota archaeon]|nr:hypothetical protein [Candidatus Woesearchaeota archaeon]
MSKLFWIVVAFLVFGAYTIKTAYDFDFEEKDDQKNFIVKFFKWVGQLFGNLKEVTGLVTHQEWLPETNETKSVNKTR